MLHSYSFCEGENHKQLSSNCWGRPQSHSPKVRVHVCMAPTNSSLALIKVHIKNLHWWTHFIKIHHCSTTHFLEKIDETRTHYIDYSPETSTCPPYRCELNELNEISRPSSYGLYVYNIKDAHYSSLALKKQLHAAVFFTSGCPYFPCMWWWLQQVGKQIPVSIMHYLVWICILFCVKCFTSVL